MINKATDDQKAFTEKIENVSKELYKARESTQALEQANLNKKKKISEMDDLSSSMNVKVKTLPSKRGKTEVVDNSQIVFLKVQVDELKKEKEELERRMNKTIDSLQKLHDKNIEDMRHQWNTDIEKMKKAIKQWED